MANHSKHGVVLGAVALLLVSAQPVLAQDGHLAGLMRQQGTVTAGQAEQAARRRFQQLDANHDGVVTEQELVDAAMKQFYAADTDGDGVLTRSEARAVLLDRLMTVKSDTTPAP